MIENLIINALSLAVAFAVGRRALKAHELANEKLWAQASYEAHTAILFAIIHIGLKVS